MLLIVGGIGATGPAISCRLTATGGPGVNTSVGWWTRLCAERPRGPNLVRIRPRTETNVLGCRRRKVSCSPDSPTRDRTNGTGRPIQANRARRRPWILRPNRRELFPRNIERFVWEREESVMVVLHSCLPWNYRGLFGNTKFIF